MLVFVLVLFALVKGSEVIAEVDNVGCASCYSAGYQYSCGMSVDWGGCVYMCCNADWVPCHYKGACEQRGCPRCSSPGLIYSQTEDGTLYSSYLTLASKSDDKYSRGKIVHSSTLSVGDLVVWSGFDFDSTKDVVITVEHHNVTEDNDKCCIGLEVGVPACELKLCCGTGCCC